MQTRKTVEKVIKDLFAKYVAAEKRGEVDGIPTEIAAAEVTAHFRNSEVVRSWAASQFFELLLGDLARFGEFQDDSWCRPLRGLTVEAKGHRPISPCDDIPQSKLPKS